ncbi:hypothetical protein Daus18300_005714 [Diaporthe australafricana]|uniref:Uncharacterized protein n=1 Tax=Diaporthe australafricana TaxID=127596 RepID=A0ABR3WYV9_9PEZI
MNQPEVLKISSGPRRVSARTAAATTKSGDREDKRREVPGSRTGNPKRLEHHHDHQDPNSIPQDAESLNVQLSSNFHEQRHQPTVGHRGTTHDHSVDRNDPDRIKPLMTNLNGEIRARGEVKRRFPQQVAGSAKTASLEALIVKDAGPAFYSDLSRRSQPLEAGKPPNHFGSMLSRQPEPAHLLMQMPHTGRDPLFEEQHQLDNGLGQGDENDLPFHDRGNPLRAPEELGRILSPVSGLPLPAVMAGSSAMRASRRQFTCGKAREVKIFKPGKASLIRISRGKSRSFSVDSLSPAQADLMLTAGAMAKSARQPNKRTEAMRHSGVRGVAFNGPTEAASAERDHQESRTSRVGLDFEEPRPHNQVIGRFSNNPKDEMRFRKLLQRLKPNVFVSSEEARIAPVQACAAQVSEQPSVVSFADIQWTTPRSSSLKHKHGYFDLNDKPTQSPVPKDNGSTLTSPHQNSANSHRLSGKSGCPSLISDDGEEPCDLPEAHLPGGSRQSSCNIKTVKMKPPSWMVRVLSV